MAGLLVLLLFLPRLTPLLCLKGTQQGVKVHLFTTVALLLPANRKSQIADFHHEFHVTYHGSSGEDSNCNKRIFIIQRNKRIRAL